jgi:hypothetical protein
MTSIGTSWDLISPDDPRYQAWLLIRAFVQGEESAAKTELFKSFERNDKVDWSDILRSLEQRFNGQAKALIFTVDSTIAAEQCGQRLQELLDRFLDACAPIWPVAEQLTEKSAAELKIEARVRLTAVVEERKTEAFRYALKREIARTNQPASSHSAPIPTTETFQETTQQAHDALDRSRQILGSDAVVPGLPARGHPSAEASTATATPSPGAQEALSEGSGHVEDRSEPVRMIVSEPPSEESLDKTPPPDTNEDRGTEVRTPSAAIGPHHQGNSQGAMGDSGDLLNLPRLDADPAVNPFPEKDVRHQVWKEATRDAKAKLHLLHFNLLQSLDTHAGDENSWLVNLAIKKFDIWVERNLRVVWDDAALLDYDNFLVTYANSWIQLYKEEFSTSIGLNSLLYELRLHLIKRIELWKSIARSFVAELQTSMTRANAQRANDVRRFPRNDVITPSTKAPEFEPTTSLAAIALCDPSQHGGLGERIEHRSEQFDIDANIPTLGDGDGNPKTDRPPADVTDQRGAATSDHANKGVGRQHGFKADMGRHSLIAGIVERHCPGWRNGFRAWRKDSILRSICNTLDEQEVEIPQGWRTGHTPSIREKDIKVTGWCDALDLGFKKLVVDHILYSLKMVRKDITPRPSEA